MSIICFQPFMMKYLTISLFSLFYLFCANSYALGISYLGPENIIEESISESPETNTNISNEEFLFGKKSNETSKLREVIKGTCANKKTFLITLKETSEDGSITTHPGSGISKAFEYCGEIEKTTIKSIATRTINIDSDIIKEMKKLLPNQIDKKEKFSLVCKNFKETTLECLVQTFETLNKKYWK